MDIEEKGNTLKVSIPLIDDEDIRIINNNFDKITDDFTNRLVTQKDLAIAQYIIRKQKAELEKKDKVINEMAIYLADIDFDECCAEIPEPCLSCSWEDYEPHINCIKRYFTNKVEKEGIKDENI